jgi:hypothetical protein
MARMYSAVNPSSFFSTSPFAGGMGIGPSAQSLGEAVEKAVPAARPRNERRLIT